MVFNADFATRLALLVAFVVLAGRSLWIAHGTPVTARRIALLSMVPYAAAYVWFYTHLMFTVPPLDGVLRADIWYSRLAAGLALLSGFAIQWVIVESGHAHRSKQQ